MIAYTTIGTNDMARAGAFYDALLAEVGAGRAMDMGRLIAAIDIDGDGQINLPELDITVARLRAPSPEEE